MYLNGEGGLKFGADVVGRFFREAGQHLVLDTLNARRSRGVWLEAKLAKARQLKQGMMQDLLTGRIRLV